MKKTVLFLMALVVTPLFSDVFPPRAVDRSDVFNAQQIISVTSRRNGGFSFVTQAATFRDHAGGQVYQLGRANFLVDASTSSDCLHILELALISNSKVNVIVDENKFNFKNGNTQDIINIPAAFIQYCSLLR